MGRGHLKTIKQAAKAKEQEVQDDPLNTRTRLKVPLVKTGQHNCPRKDAGEAHVFTTSCLRKGHAGFCPETDCGLLVSGRYGCRRHGWKGVSLLSKVPNVEDATMVETEKEEEREEPKLSQDASEGKNGKQKRN